IRSCRNVAVEAVKIQTEFQINNPLVTKLFDNSLMLIFNEDSNIVNVIDYFYLSRSYDYGKTFTVPRMIDLPGYREIKITGNIVQMGRSRLLLPLQAINQKRERLCLILISHNKGKSWDTLLKITSATHNGQFNHPVLLPVMETLYCLLENEKGYQYSACSYDSGKTWSKPECTNIYGKSANLLLSSDGYLLCCYQDETPQGISMMKSFDRGKTWEKEIQVIEANQDIFYPYLLPLKNGGVLILYSQGKSIFDKSEAKWQVKGNFITLGRIKTPKAVAASLKGDEVHLRWNKVKRASYYIVYRSSPADSPFGPEQRIAYPGLNKYVDYIVKNANKYYYSISAVEGYGKLLADTGSESALSQPVIIEVK
ncbi:MAG: exo-alpha-sialidase, partial [bacterium]